jgi:N-acetylglutamate synthase-like GNAT family acetyltransferase
MLRKCINTDFLLIHSIINDAAIAYKGAIPADRWHDPYMTQDQLRTEINKGVVFWGWEEKDGLAGVMGIQDVKDVTLIRHAYVKTILRDKGIGTKLLNHLMGQTSRPVLIGTWKAALWAIKFYRKNGFELVTEEEKNLLLAQYWSIPSRQIETSVVLADANWMAMKGQDKS